MRHRLLVIFFFQAEDGIRDHCVTGVQTCALPISTNQPVIKSIWGARPAGEPLAGITSFKVAPDKTPEDWLLDILDAVELHHGEHSQSPPYSVLRVVGTPLSPRLREELGEYGFVRFEDSADGFVAHKLAALSTVATANAHRDATR